MPEEELKPSHTSVVFTFQASTTNRWNKPLDMRAWPPIFAFELLTKPEVTMGTTQFSQFGYVA